MSAIVSKHTLETLRRGTDLNMECAALIVGVIAVGWVGIRVAFGTAPPLLEFSDMVATIGAAYLFVSISAYFLKDALEPNPVENLAGADLISRVSEALEKHNKMHADVFAQARAFANLFLKRGDNETAASKLFIMPSLSAPDRERPAGIGLFQPPREDFEAFDRRMRQRGRLPSPEEREARVRTAYRRQLRASLERAIGQVVSDVAPADFATTFIGILCLILTALVVLFLQPTAAHGLILEAGRPFDLGVAALVIADQLLKGLIIDVLEFFSWSVLSYQIDYRALAPTLVLFGLRIVPVTVSLKVIGHYLQQGALRRLVTRLTIEPEEEVLERTKTRDR